ncbi:MAG: LysR family transcriptional regulator [Bifidobacterium bifidum]
MFPLLDTLGRGLRDRAQFTLAADELKVSQSTVSSRIAQLELALVGAPLFDRNAKSDVTPDRRLGGVAVPCGGRHRRHVARYARVSRSFPHAREP